MSTLSKTAASRRPGGRTADVTQRIHRAVTAILMEGGAAACTFKAVAERASVERSTLHRRYSDRWDMMLDSMLIRAAEELLPTLGDSFPDDLTSVLTKLARMLESPLGPTMLSAAAEFRAHSRSDFTRNFFDRRMAQLDPMFDAAVARGELPADVDREALFSFAAGPIYFRIFIAARGVDDAFIAFVVASVCRLYCLPGDRSKVPLPSSMP